MARRTKRQNADYNRNVSINQILDYSIEAI
jgi:hypothetical protein